MTNCNFSLQCPYIIQQVDNENIQTYKERVVKLTFHQILKTNLQETVWQLEGRINNQILKSQRVKGLEENRMSRSVLKFLICWCVSVSYVFFSFLFRGAARTSFKNTVLKANM